MSNVRDQIELLSRKLELTRDSIATEEATKTTLIMPFIRDVLGFDVFNVNEVIPEFVADVGIKKGEKIDFAIVNDGEVAILIECKKIGEHLTLENANQLFRYFHVTSARIAVLTNGDEYRFYTDLDEPNKMDEKPFLELALSDVDLSLIPEIEKLSRNRFDLNSVLSAAEELKYVSAAKRVFANEFKELSPELATLVIKRIYVGSVTQRVREELSPLVGKGLQQFVTDQVDRRLKTAISDKKSPEIHVVEETLQEQQVEIVEDGIVTTEDELRAVDIIRAISAKIIDPLRIGARDAKSYCPILLDDNNRQTILRLRFNNPERLRIGLMMEDKSEVIHELASVSEIYNFTDEIRVIIERFLGTN